ncbi:alpha/beta hydrolase [Kribbella sp. NPDC002412]
MTRPGVDLVRHPAEATDLVLLAHGGMENSQAVPHTWRPPILRMWPFAWSARAAAPDAAVGLMRYRYRGWNGAAADPVADLRAVLDELPPVVRRVVLIGHSMGGRAVLAVGDHPRVAGVLALAPWLPPGEPLTALRPPVTLAHGTEDRITDPRATAAYANRLRAAGTPVRVCAVAGETHAMLRRPADWNTLVADFTAMALGISTVDDAQPAATGDELLAQHGRKTPLPAAVWSIAAARLRLPIVARCSAGKGTAAGRDLG